MSDPLRRDNDGGLAVLTIDFPPLNLWGDEMWAALPAALDALAASPPRALLIRAEGRVVSAGVNVQHFQRLNEQSALVVWQQQLAMLQTLEALPCPTVFAAHALTLTAAFELALGCDVIVAARSASFGLVERRVGLTPSSGGVQRIAALAGANRARDLVFSGDIVDAETMREWGVVTRVYDDEGFDQAARDFALDLAAGPPLGFSATKQLVREFTRGGVAAADAIMPPLAASLFPTSDAQRALAGFVEHGPRFVSEFEGR